MISLKLIFLKVRLNVNHPFRKEKRREGIWVPLPLGWWLFFVFVYGYIISLNILCSQCNPSDVYSDEISNIILMIRQYYQAQMKGDWSNITTDMHKYWKLNCTCFWISPHHREAWDMRRPEDWVQIHAISAVFHSSFLWVQDSKYPSKMRKN